jgi:hypothetical protein
MAGVRVMVFNAPFNNISVISCMAVSFIGGGGRETWVTSCAYYVTADMI